MNSPLPRTQQADQAPPERPLAPEQRRVAVQPGAAAPAPWYIKLLWGLARSLFRLVFRVRVIGLEHVPSTPSIICLNHLGWAEPLLTLFFLPVEPRVYGLAEAVSVLRSAWRVRLIRTLAVMIPLDRAQPVAALRVMADVLGRGGSLLLCPEGHLGTQEGELLPLEPGAAHLSLRTGVPLLPVGATGTRDLWLRRTLTLRIGPPIAPPANVTHRRAAVDALTVQLDHDMRALLPGDLEQPHHKPLHNFLTHLF